MFDSLVFVTEMLIIMNNDKHLGQEFEFEELIYNFVTPKSRKY